MSSPSKVVIPSVPSARGHLYRVAIVGAATLKGKEVIEMLKERNFPSIDVRLLDDDESIGQLEATGDEMNFIQSVRSEQFSHVDFTFFAGDGECTRANWKRARDAGSTIIDLSGALEGEPDAQVRSLWLERERGEIRQPELQPAPCVVPHPAAVMLALLLLRASKAGVINNASATIFEPASEQGQKGMDELHQQTVNLLSFQPLPKNVFDEQVAFNMLVRYGTNSRLSLASLETRVHEQYAKLVGEQWAQPAIMMLQAPVFHGESMAIFLEMEQSAQLERVSQALAGDHVSIISGEESYPSNVSTAGQPDIVISLKADTARPNGIWIWAAADNLRLAASAAVEAAESLTATRPLGKIQ
jgi:aspartate-semialdehyde dehydrogenase